MPTKACSHQDNRAKICAPCGRRIVLGKKTLSFHRINDSVEKLIKKFANASFNLSDTRFPTSVCNNCRFLIRNHDQGNNGTPLKIMPNYVNVGLKNINNEHICDCSLICGNARATLFTKKPDSGKKRKSDSVVLCKSCMGVIGKGIRHDCDNPKKRRKRLIEDNVSNIVKQLLPEQRDHIAYNIIREKIDEKQNVPVFQKNTATLRTTGTPCTVTLNSKKPKKVYFPEAHLKNFQNNNSVSNGMMSKTVNFLRAHAGRDSVSKDWDKIASENSRILDKFYRCDEFEFDVEKSSDFVNKKNKKTKKKKQKKQKNKKAKKNQSVNGEKKQQAKKELRPCVYVDASELLDFLVEERQIIGHYDVKIMIDKGKEFLKASMAIFPKNYSMDSNTVIEENSGDEGDGSYLQGKKSSFYSEGGSSGNKRVLSSVKRLILLCVVPQAQETYENLKLLFDWMRINNLPYKFVSDFKLLLVAIGQQTASSTYPCPYCFVTLSSLRNGVPAKNQLLKTFGDLNDSFNKFCDINMDKKLAKDCESTINPPLFDETSETTVLSKCIIPELHILQGFVNHLFWNGLVKLLGEKVALIWPTKINAIAKNYHGRVFEGNACRKMIKEVDTLLDDEILQSVDRFQLEPYIQAFKCMDKVVTYCFSTKLIGDENVPKLIDNLKKSIKATRVSVTLKIHVLLEHLTQCLSYLKNMQGLGYWSEQAGESVHYEFYKIWERLKINNMKDPSYKERLRRAVVIFSSQHI